MELGRVSNLMKVGYSKEDAEYLSQHEHFHHKTKTTEELLAVFQKIADVYGLDLRGVMERVVQFPSFSGYNHVRIVSEAAAVYGDEEAVKKAVMRWPKFAGLNHERVVREATAVYGDEEAVKKAVRRFPAFAGLDHERVVREATAVYGDVEAVKKAVMKSPQFAGLDHERVVREATAVYGDVEAVKKAVMNNPQFANLDHVRVVREATAVYGDEEAVKKNILKWPKFSGLDHERVVREATAVYGDEEAVKKAVMRFPAFAGYDHEKKIFSLFLLGEIAGLKGEEIPQLLLNVPTMAAFAVKRFVAGLDVAKSLEKEGHPMDENMRDAYIRYVNSSPYVPRTKRRRISQCPAGSPEPPLLKKMRTSLQKAA
jgi:hypothetical protein